MEFTSHNSAEIIQHHDRQPTCKRVGKVEHFALRQGDNLPSPLFAGNVCDPLLSPEIQHSSEMCWEIGQQGYLVVKQDFFDCSSYLYV